MAAPASRLPEQPTGFRDAARHAKVATRRPWLVQMRWHDLVFCHWRVAKEVVQARLPAGLVVDMFEGQAWLSTVHFLMTDVRLRPGLGVPGHTRMRELNVRTYVRDEAGERGIWFFTIDCESRPIVEAVRRGFCLPYLHASFSGDLPTLACQRTDPRATQAHYEVAAAPSGLPRTALTGTVDEFLHERYVLFARDAKERIRRGRVAHEPYPLQPVSVQVRSATVLEGWPIDARVPDRVTYSRGFPVVAWPLERP